MFSLRKRREAAGLTVTQLADKLGVTPSSVCQWESGNVMPNAGKLPELAKALGCTIDDLYEKEVG